MKLLILSFFAVILGYSLLFNEKEEISQPIHGIDNSVYIHKFYKNTPNSNIYSVNVCLLNKYCYVCSV